MHRVKQDLIESSLKEIELIVNSLKNNKLPGWDNMNPELLKTEQLFETVTWT